MKTSSLCRIFGLGPLALTSVLALANNCAADNTVVYHQGPILLNQASPTTDLDLDQDGVPDFRFSVGILAGLPSPGAPSTSTPYLDTFAFNRNDYLLNAEGRMVLKEAGFKFGPKTKADESWGHRDSESQAIAYASGSIWPGFNGKPPKAFIHTVSCGGMAEVAVSARIHACNRALALFELPKCTRAAMALSGSVVSPLSRAAIANLSGTLLRLTANSSEFHPNRRSSSGAMGGIELLQTEH